MPAFCKTPIIQTMTPEQLAAPDNGADRTITLVISGNRLVSVLNALDGALYQTGRYHLDGDFVVASSPWYQALRETTEAIRDELSRQRCDDSEHKAAVATMYRSIR